ncbi:MAG: hypothetical protein Q4A74_06035 [Cardiobacteriaceae bacterium]|nr:hypothetical protein [Cardiobacteriaceae bacterium]
MAFAQMPVLGEATLQVWEKVKQEAIQEAIKSGQEPTRDNAMKSMMDKMRAHIDELKKALVEDCTIPYGQEKSDNCKCVTDKGDYNKIFSFIEKVEKQPEEAKKESKILREELEDNYKSCDLDFSVAQKAMKNAAQKMRKH